MFPSRPARYAFANSHPEQCMGQAVYPVVELRISGPLACQLGIPEIVMSLAGLLPAGCNGRAGKPAGF